MARSSLFDRLESIVRADAALMQLLHAGRRQDLPQWRLVAGCLYQTVWNVLTGRAQGHGIADYDLIYFDAHDLSTEAELASEAKLRAALPSLPAPVEARNQARVHLWFEDYFGIPYSPLSSVEEAIIRYASTTHCVGIRLTPDDRFDIFAPYGLEDIFSLIMRPNYILPNAETYERKAARCKAQWPELTVIAWS